LGKSEDNIKQYFVIMYGKADLRIKIINSSVNENIYTNDYDIVFVPEKYKTG
jgi:hypothetical protein